MTTVWGLHSRPDDETTYRFFVDNGYIGIAWARFGDMRLIADDFGAFAAVVKKHWPDVGYSNIASQCHRFVYATTIGDVVVYPSPLNEDNTLRIGIITGDYEHNPQVSYDCSDLRRVEWRVTTSRDQFRLEQLKSLNSRRTFFEIHEHPEVFLEAVGQA